MTIRELSCTHSSCRTYKPDPVDRTLLLDLIETARYAPNAFNAQMWRFFVAAEEQAKAVAKLFPNTWTSACPAFIAIAVPEGSTVVKNRMHDFNAIDCGIVAAHLCLAASERGLGSCILGSVDEDAICYLAHIPRGMRVHAVVAIGYPQGADTPKDRKPIGELVTFI